MKKVLLSGIVAAGVVAASTSFAAAAPCMTPGVANPWYVGVGINYPAIQNDEVTVGSAKLDQDDKNIGGNIFVGYRANRYFGTELGFNYLGDTDYKVKSTSSKAEYDNQWNVNFVGQAFLPVAEWFSPYVFGGVAYMNSDFRVKGSGVPGIGRFRSDFGGFGLIYGAGLQFNINQFGIRASYTRLDAPTSVNNALTSDTFNDKDFISLDVLYRFSA